MGRRADPAAPKDLKALRLYAEKPPFLPLDAGPFTICYLWLTWRTLSHVWAGTWESATELKFILGALVGAQVLVKLFAHWFVGFRCVLRYNAAGPQDASHVKVTPADFTGHKEVVRLERRRAEDGGVDLSFEFRKQRYCYLPQQHAFERLRFPDKEPWEHYSKASGYGKEAELLAAVERWGPNKFEVPPPKFAALLQEQLLAPFFVFQTFCVGLWCLDEYWYYSLFTLFMLVTFECTVVAQRMRQMAELRALQTPRQPALVHRQGRWEKLPGEALLPGDVVSVARPTGAGAEDRVLPADLLLLAGSCIVEEAVLTGESTPQWKQPLPPPDDCPGSCLDVGRDRAHVLFGGTKVLQHTPDKQARLRPPDGGCPAVVLRTGFETSQGQLMRTILFSTERVTGNNWETGLFILFLLVFAVAASAYVLFYGLQDPERSRFKLLLNCTMIVTSVIPPELPMELSIAVNTSLLNLARKAVFCTEPFRIPLAGKVGICCFDKTGTLTSDNMRLEGLAGLPGCEPGVLKDAREAPREAQRVLACCQALIQVDGDTVGDPLERAALEAIGWSQTPAGAASPPRLGGGRENVTILHRHHFSSALKRMSAVVRVEREGSNESELWVLCKGAPEVVRDFLAEVPPSYEAEYRRYAAQGGRVLALAHKRLPADLTAAAVRELPRAEAEAGLAFAGFAVLQCPLKPESEPALRALKQARHCLVMITGDAPLTACHAAGRVHIIDRPALILSLGDGHPAGGEPQDGSLRWVSPDGQTQRAFSRERAAALALASEFDLCIAGDALTVLHRTGADATYVPLAQVFARVSPDQKELVLRLLRAAGWVTLMCGDGTNDVGALKTAHVGVALLSPKERKPGEQPEASGAGATASGSGGGRGSGAAGRGRGGGAAGGRGAGSSSCGGAAAAAPKPGQAKPAKPAAPGPGTKMLEEMRRKGKPVDEKMERMAAWLDGLARDAGAADMGDAPMVKPGDASMASPFTAKAGHVLPCTDIIKQGRSTLVTTVQMFKILGLLCLSTAYSMSVMYLQGVKVGDLQATAQGFLSAYMFFVISNGKPLERLSPERPHPSIFSPYVFLSVTGQFALHMGFLVYMYTRALASMPPDHVQKPDADFAPNLVNTVCFLVQWVVQLTTFGVNYVGHPFNQSLQENRGLAAALRWGAIGFALATLNVIPGTDWALSLVPLPRILCVQLLAMAFLDYSLSLSWEAWLRRRFPAPCPPAKGYLAFQAELPANGGGSSSGHRKRE